MQRAILAILAVLVLIGLYQSDLLQRIDARNGPITEPVELEIKGAIVTEPDYSDDWWYATETGPSHKVVNTYFRSLGHETETEAECEARHTVKVARLQGQFPPITPP